MFKFNLKILNFNHFLFLIILSILFLLYEGLIYNYYQIFSYYYYSEFRYDRGGYNPIFWEENGLVEFTQVIILFISIIILFKHIKLQIKNLSRSYQIILFLYLLALIYYFFEEISWGQHLFFWNSPEFFLEFNSQKETNFHNISNLLNDLPRTFLMLLCTISFIVNKLISSRLIYLKFLILPNSKLIYLSFLILLFVIPDFLIDILNIDSFYYSWEIEKHPFNFSIDLIQIISFNFVRLSELQELLFNLYILSHIYYLKKYTT
tara:strand:+ start:53 stop:841 length:789 start_codon:yes stop_codon:yes gene_type:complete